VAERKYPALATDVIYRPNYDNLGRIMAGNTYQGGTDILKFAYDYEPNTYNISRIKFDHRTSDPCNEFTYDNLDRLTMAEYGVDETNEIFTMDDLGNRDLVNLRDDSNEDYVIDNITNRYTSVGGDNLEYDKAGNLTKDKDGYEYEYDYENRITKIKKNGTITVAQFAYDALGCRIRKTDSIADTNTLYYYGSGWQVLAEYNGAGTFQRRFVYGNYIDEPLVMNYGSNDYYYTHDHLYDSAALLDSSGSVVERYEYDAYGNPYILTSQYAPRDTSQYGNPYMFTGREVDILDAGSLKMQYNRNRNYDYYTGRWLTPDPMPYIDSLNVYEYVLSKVLKYTDPYGLMGIGGKINGIFASRVITPIINVFRANEYILNDDEDEITAELKYVIDAFYASQIKEDAGKAEFDIEKVSGRWEVQSTGVFSTGWWLHGAHRVSAKGSFDYCCEKHICKLTNISVDWNWYDDIDAHSFVQALNEYEKGAKEWSWLERRLASIGLTIESLWDLFGDKIIDTDFRVRITWKESRKQPLKIVK
jgi:RHS repeat-associated protein